MNKTTLQNGLLLAISLVVSLFVCEIMFRVWSGIPVLELRNLAESKTVGIAMGTAEYDRNLGWRPVPNEQYHFGPRVLTQLEHGIRSNGAGGPGIRTGGILVVGDSFAAGSEVSDDETWPAFLEGELKVPVVNGGVGAYGTDQIVLRAEQLLSMVRPKVLLIGMLMADIERAGYSSFGRPKPYFMVDETGLALHNSPVPLSAPGDIPVPAWKRILAHSYLANGVMSVAVGPLWYRHAEQRFARVANDQVEVTCRLLQRLKRKTDAEGIRTLLVMQYGGTIIHVFDSPRPLATQVEACARLVGIQVVDEFEALKAVDRQGPDALKPYYNMHGDKYGHMSARGNELIASLVVTALKQPPVAGDAESYAPEPFIPGDGKNIVSKPESLEKLIPSSPIAAFSPTSATMISGRSYRLAARGPAGEHYVGLGGLPGEPGPHTLSMEVKGAGTTCLFLQILDDGNNGVLTEINLATATVGAQPLGDGKKVSGNITSLDHGWYRLWASVKTAAPGLRVLFQLGNAKCDRAFTPGNEAVLLRKVQLERGQSASAYNAPN